MITYNLSPILLRNGGQHELTDLISGGKIYDGLIAGGSVRNLVGCKQLDSDIDYFFHKKEECDAAFTWFKEKGAKVVSENEFNISLQYKTADKEYEIQLIKFYHPTVEAPLESFDFTICQFALLKDKVYTGDMSLLDLGGKKLVPHKITFPVASMRRAIKYAKKGFYMCAGSAKEFLEKCAAEMDNLTNVEVSRID